MTAPFAKPTKVARFGGTSAAETGNSAEPAAGKKDVGWVLDDEPPSSTLNWLHYRTYKWFRWFFERMFDLGGGVGFKLAAPVVDTAADDGGDLELYGADSGANADKDGGDVLIAGGDATGAGSSNVTLQVATRGAAGVGARVKENYLRCIGDTLAGASTRGIIQIDKTVFIDTPAASDGSGLEINTSTGTGHTLVLAADISSPANSALSILPQDADPTTTGNGDVYVNSDSDQLNHYSASLGRFQAVDTLVHVTQGIVVEADVGAAEATFTGATFTVPVGTLRVGSIIKTRAWGLYDAAAADAWQVNMRFGSGALGGRNIVARHTGDVAVADQYWMLESEILVKVAAVAGTITYRGEGKSSRGTPAVDLQSYITDHVAFNTEAPPILSVQFDFVAAAQGNELELYGFVVEVL
jgi:hypothetical protein